MLTDTAEISFYLEASGRFSARWVICLETIFEKAIEKNQMLPIEEV